MVHVAESATANDLRTERAIGLHGVTWVRFADNTDQRGRLTAIEAGAHVPIEIRRVLFVYQVSPLTDRGGHADRDTDQVLACVHDRMKVDVSDGRDVLTFLLDDAAVGINVPRMCCIRLYDFQHDAVLAVLANTSYDQKRSIRSWPEYRTELQLGDAPEPRARHLVPEAGS